MYIKVAYKDAPELSSLRRRSLEQEDQSVEKTLLVNPNCPVRIMLEYIRKRCRLAIFTQFDLCDETGVLMGLFKFPTYVYVTDRFEHKKTYYLVVMKQEQDKSLSILPQLNHDNLIYDELIGRIKYFLATGEMSPAPTIQSTQSPGKITPPSLKQVKKK